MFLNRWQTYVMCVGSTSGIRGSAGLNMPLKKEIVGKGVNGPLMLFTAWSIMSDLLRSQDDTL